MSMNDSEEMLAVNANDDASYPNSDALNLHASYVEADADFVSKLCLCAVISLCSN